MHVSSPDVFAPKPQRKEFVDIDLIEDNNCSATGEYASHIFAYLREAEVRKWDDGKGQDKTLIAKTGQVPA